MTKIRYSKDIDALLIELSDKPIDHAEESGRFVFHFAEDGEPVLLEVFDAKEFLIDSFTSVVEEKELAIS